MNISSIKSNPVNYNQRKQTSFTSRGAIATTGLAAALSIGLSSCGGGTLEEKNSRILSKLAKNGDANIPYYFDGGINSYFNNATNFGRFMDKYQAFDADGVATPETQKLLYQAYDEGLEDAKIEETLSANKERRLLALAKEAEKHPKTAALNNDFLENLTKEEAHKIEERKMLDIIKTTRANHPELKGAKLDSAISFEVAIAKKMELLKKQERQSNYLISFYNKGMQSIKDSLSGKNLNPFNVIKTPNLGENLKMQAFYLGQQRIRMSLDTAKVNRMLKQLLKQCAR